MIFELNIKDFILINEVNISFTKGFNILTGETGAGKSMVLGAIDLILGGQANKDSVRIGAEKAVIKAGFYTNDEINNKLIEFDIPHDEDVLVIAREIQLKGKSLSRINGQVVTLNHLKTITDYLINIHGQNEHQILLERDHQLELLDAFGGNNVLSIKDEVAVSFHAIKLLENELKELNLKASERHKQIDFLSFQRNEIELAKLKEDEDLSLEKEYEYLSNIGNVIDGFDKASKWLIGDYGDGAVNVVSSLASQFKKLESYDPKLSDFSSRLNELYFIMEDLSKDVEHMSEKTENDPERFAYIEKRLDEINNLKTKYGKTITEINAYLSKIIEELDAYEGVEETIAKKTIDYNNALESYNQLASALSDKRKNVAVKFETALQNELIELNMKATQFKVEINKSAHLMKSGIDEIDFTISTNVGQPFKLLKKVVSGGELSRIMLGIKIVLGRLDGVPTLVFDEIDAGISGITANIVGEKLSRLAEYCQIICITHLPQIAVYADHHLLIEKISDTNSTETLIKEIYSKEIEMEIGRLVGGIEVTELTTTHAREMLENAMKNKSSFNVIN